MEEKKLNKAKGIRPVKQNFQNAEQTGKGGKVREKVS